MSKQTPSQEFVNKVVLITGASSGIGAATALHFAKKGAKLSICGRNQDNLNKVAEECRKEGADPLTVIADITSKNDCDELVKKTIDRFGSLDVLVNNAGILETGSIENTSLEQYDNIFDTNVKAVYYLTMIAVPYLVQSKGNIVNVSSVAGTRSFPGILAYCMSKAALDQFTKCITLELAPKGIRVNSVNPGVIITDIHRRAGIDEKSYQEYLEKCKTTHALGRVGSPNEVAECISFLASDSASFVTGCLLPVDGGRHAMCPR